MAQHHLGGSQRRSGWAPVGKVPCAIISIEGPLYLEQEGLKVAKHLCVICASQVSGQRLKSQKDNKSMQG